jgi:hypothetical protein
MLRAATLTGLLLVSLGLCSATQRQPLPEGSIKAAFLLKFAEFVAWPEPVTGPFTVCLSAAHPFGSTITDLAQGATVHGRPLVVRTLDGGDSDRGCQVAYLTPSDHDRLRALASRPVLTVGDASDFCTRGGIINFRTVQGRVRFEIHLGNARTSGFAIDSQLLRLALDVHGGRP